MSIENSQANVPSASTLRILRWFCPPQIYEEIEGDLIQKFNHDVKQLGPAAYQKSSALALNSPAWTRDHDAELAAAEARANETMPVPDPDSKIRVEYCALKAGEYKLTVTPSTGDFFAHAGVDCNRFGPEGLKRLKRLGK